MIVPGSIERTSGNQFLEISNAKELAVPLPLDLQFNRIDVGGVAQQDDRLGIERLHASPDCR